MSTLPEINWNPSGSVSFSFTAMTGAVPGLRT
jgi:hypothetical protein